MMLTLSIRNVAHLADGLPLRFVLDRGDAIVGRSVSCDWVLPDPENHVSGRHCEIHYRDGAYVLTDISTNGTYLNGADDGLDDAHVIADGDVLEIGHYQIVATLTADVEVTAPPSWPVADDAAEPAAPVWPAPEPGSLPEPELAAEPEAESQPAPAVAVAPEAVPAAVAQPEAPPEPSSTAVTIDGRYRLDGAPDRGTLFEEVRATDLLLDRTVLIRLAPADATPAEKVLIAGHVARWHAFARHRIVGMPTILAIGQSADVGGRDYLVIDLTDASPLDRVLTAESVRSFRSWLLDRVLCDVLRTLTEIHARKLVHGDIAPANILVSPMTGAVFLTNPAPEPESGQPRVAGDDVFALGKLLEDAAWQIGATPRAVIGWMTAPETDRPTAAELLETIGLGMQAMMPVFAPSDPAPPPQERVSFAAPQSPPAAGWDDGGGTRLVPGRLSWSRDA